jgi:hypothetical protein
MSRKSQIPKFLSLFFSFLLIVLFYISCDKPTIDYGSQFITNNNTNVVVIDSVTTQLSTVSLDSFPTAATGAQMIGSYHDPYFGTITSSSYLQIGPPPTIYVPNTAGLDSIDLILRLNKTFYGDTTLPITIDVSQLDTVISLPQPFIQATFYNNSSIPYNSTPWGSATFVVSPTDLHTTQNYQDSVKIRLPDSLGVKILDLMEYKSDSITNINTFLSYFKGVYIYPDPSSSGVIYGFRDTAFIKLYYHEPSIFPDYTYTILPFNAKGHQFNHITFDRTGTQLANISSPVYAVPYTDTHILPATATSDSSVYLQGGTGLQVKLQFPYLANLLQLPDYIGILRADLILQPVFGSYSPELALPPQVILSQSNPANTIGTTITGTAGVQYGTLDVDYIYGQNTYYTYDITAYVKQIIVDPMIYQDALIFNMPPPSSVTTMNRAVFQNKRFSTTNYYVTLKIYYISLVH